jgi:superfamily II DNA or RNA helicase
MPTDLQQQIERRRQRALEEIKKVVNRGSHPVFSQFEVHSQSGQLYRVEIRSLTELQNTCTCADYKTNQIGTCKHIEGVLLSLRDQHGQQLEALARKRPQGTQIYLRYGEEITVQVGLPLPRVPAVRPLLTRFFDAKGVLVGQPLQALPALFEALTKLPAREQKLVRVAEAVREHLELLQDREAVQQQKEWFLEQVKSGGRTFDVLATKLYPYQETGAMHLAFGGRAMLADDMGLGKTVQAIAAAALLKELRGVERVLIVTPASLKHQWAREIRRFSSLPVTVVEGNLKARRAAYRTGAFFTILNYELVRHDLAELEPLRPNLVILDEAQRIKNWRSKTAQAVKRLKSRYAFVLTGTPLENRLDELYSIFQFLDPRILGPLWHFNDRFYDLEQRADGSYKVIGYKNFAELRSTIEPYTLRRTRDEVLKDLPDRVDNNFFVEMTDPQWQAYNEYREIVARLSSIAHRRPLTPPEKDRLLRSLLKMRLICNALALHDKEIPPKDREKTAPKLAELEHILADEVAHNGHKAVVFSQWAGMLALTQPLIKRVGLGYVTLTGAVPSAKRGALIERFFDDPKCKVFFSTDAGGVGLNLQAASLVVNLDLPWNPAVLEQRIGRAHRHGQPRTVNVINLIAHGTIEERMLETLAAKRNVFAGVFGTEEAPAHLSFQDAGQGLLKRLDELLGPASHAPRLEAAPPPPAEPLVEVVATPAPTLKGFADLLVARLAHRVLLVRKAPVGEGVLVVVDRDPAALRPDLEGWLRDYFAPAAPALHLMEPEGYQALSAFWPPAAATPGDEPFRAAALPSAAGASGREEQRRRLKKASAGFDFAAKRLAFAEVALKGGFPEEMLRPLGEALGWALNALLAACGPDREPSADLPSARLVQAELIEPGHLSADLAARLARVRELTAPMEGESAPPPSLKTGETLGAAVHDLIELGRNRIVVEGL